MDAVSGKVVHISRKLPAARRQQIAPNGVVAMVIVVFAEIMFFAGLISAFAIAKTTAFDEWPPPWQPRLPIEETAFNTVALLASGVVMYFAHRRFARDPSSARAPFLVSMLLGAFFVLFQGAEWVSLIGQGLTLTTSTHGSFFYLIVGTHALHAVAALLALTWAYVKLRAGTLLSATFVTVQIFWYFVVLLWPILYFQVYL